MTNTPERISLLAEAIMQMAELDKGIIKSRLEKLILQHCAASVMESNKPFVPRPEDYATGNKLNLHPGGLNFVLDSDYVPPGGWFCVHTGKRLTDP